MRYPKMVVSGRGDEKTIYDIPVYGLTNFHGVPKLVERMEQFWQRIREHGDTNTQHGWYIHAGKYLRHKRWPTE